MMKYVSLVGQECGPHVVSPQGVSFWLRELSYSAWSDHVKYFIREFLYIHMLNMSALLGPAYYETLISGWTVVNR